VYTFVVFNNTLQFVILFAIEEVCGGSTICRDDSCVVKPVIGRNKGGLVLSKVSPYFSVKACMLGVGVFVSDQGETSFRLKML
jgi:hypothetical protein